MCFTGASEAAPAEIDHLRPFTGHGVPIRLLYSGRLWYVYVFGGGAVFLRSNAECSATAGHQAVTT